MKRPGTCIAACLRNSTWIVLPAHAFGEAICSACGVHLYFPSHTCLHCQSGDSKLLTSPQVRGSKREPLKVPWAEAGLQLYCSSHPLAAVPHLASSLTGWRQLDAVGVTFLHNYGHVVTITSRNHLRKERLILQRGGAITGQHGELAQAIAIGARGGTCLHHRGARTRKPEESGRGYNLSASLPERPSSSS